MGHAHHFLSRLDRVSLPHVELALGLYNDAPLLQYILYSARLPEGAARAAISLDHPERGPFLVVTREGRFVTCLGEGMSPGDLPVITRGQLDALAAKVTVLRARIEECRRLAGPTGGLGKLIRRVHEAADDLPREEIVPILGLAPLYSFEFFRFLLAAADDLVEAREILLPHLRRSERLKPQFRDGLRSYWNTFWSMGHYAVLAAADGAAVLDRIPPPAVEMLDKTSISWSTVRQGMASLALKGIWAVARIGKPLLAGTKHRYHRAETPLTFIDSCMGLGALSLRHAKLQTEITKALEAGPDIPRDHPRGALIHAMNGVMRAVLDPEALASGDIMRAHRLFGARVAVLATQQLPRGAPNRFEREEEVPDDVALVTAVNAQLDFMLDNEQVTPMFVTLPWVARAAPEQLYLPRALMAAYHQPWTPEHTLTLLRAHRDYYKVPQRKPEGPARKGPCPCGSGKKYKRCCGAEKEAEKEGAGATAEEDDSTA